MLLGYNTNGLAHHRLVDAIDLLADEGYQSVAITLDAGALDPFEEQAHRYREINKVLAALDRRGLARVIETGARYLLNPRMKHDPTLLDPDPARRGVRLDFLVRAVDVAKALGAESVSLWSGRAPDAIGQNAGMDRLVDALRPLLDYAEKAAMTLGFEPEPGMFIDTLDSFAQLDERIRHPLFQLTIDLGHIHCLGEGDVHELLSCWRRRVVNMHIEDMVHGVHEHLLFGHGTMDFPAIFRSLHTIGYDKGVHVELSRHSHMAIDAVRASRLFLGPLIGLTPVRPSTTGIAC
jgi:L-ribulose-5-phosphate 3-epimerase